MKKIFILSFILINYLFASLDYEIIRNYDNKNQLVTIYLNKNEIFSLIGDDYYTYREAYSFISKIILYNQLNYSKDLVFIQQIEDDTYGLYWDDVILLKFTGDVKLLNEQRKNTLYKLKKYISTISEKDELKINLNLFKNKINKIKKLQIVDINKKFHNDKYFPAVHSNLPLGTKLRITNLKNYWSIVVKIVKNSETDNTNIIGIGKEVSKALKLETDTQVKVKVL